MVRDLSGMEEWWCWRGAGGQVDRLGGTVGGRKLEKRAEHDDEARSNIHVVRLVKTREKYIH